MSSVGMNPMFVDAVQIAYCFLGKYCCKAHALTKVVAWPWKSKWSLISATCQGGCTWLPTWYNTTSPELQVAPLTLAKCELKAWSTGVSRNKFKLASTFFEASLAFRRKTPSGNRLGWSRKLISLATTWLKRCCSKWFWFCKLFAKAPMGLCFLSEAKQFGKRPCLAKESGKWSIQCHFLINGVSKAAAKWSMASSMAAKRLALVVTPAWLPSCTWSIAMAMASKA